MQGTAVLTTNTFDTCVGDVRLDDPGEVIRAEEDGLLELLAAEHLKRDVEALEEHACLSNEKSSSSSSSSCSGLLALENGAGVCLL